MKNLIFYFFVLILALYQFSCSTKKIEKKEVKKDTISLIVENETDFLKNKKIEARFNISEKSEVYNIFLFKPNKEILLVLDLPKNTDEISYIRYKSYKINENYLLIRNYNYFYDRKNNKLYIILKIPHIYFLTNLYLSTIDIYISTSDKNKIVKITKNFAFHWKPMLKEGRFKYSFKYSNNIINDFYKLDESVIKSLKNQISLIDKNRISDEYKNLVKALEDKIK